MEIIYVKTISGSHYKIEGNELEVETNGIILQIADGQGKDLFPWENVEYVHMTTEDKDETD